MKIKKLGMLVPMLIILFIVYSCISCANANVSCDNVEKNNHFRVYRITGAEANNIGVTVKDQFSQEPIQAALSTVDYFANPVSKNNGKIPRPEAHLTWYKLDEHAPVIKRIVTFNNQFGQEQKWTLGRAIYLLVPSEKKEEGSSRPDRFNHFKCYEVLEGEFQERTVNLKDQFDKVPIKVVVKKPMYFCNPVEKNGEPIVDKEYHLAFYLISPLAPEPTLPQSVKIENQFKENNFRAIQSIFLGVPSKKRGFQIIK